MPFNQGLMAHTTNRGRINLLVQQMVQYELRSGRDLGRASTNAPKVGK